MVVMDDSIAIVGSDRMKVIDREKFEPTARISDLLDQPAKGASSDNGRMKMGTKPMGKLAGRTGVVQEAMEPGELEEMVKELKKGSKDTGWQARRRTARQTRENIRGTLPDMGLNDDDKLLLLEEGDPSMLNGQLHH